MHVRPRGAARRGGTSPATTTSIHSHYWLSGQVGALARDRWGVPLVHSMHTMAKVKNAALADGDTPEPAARLIGEEQVVEAADMLIANTDLEANQLIELYDAEPGAGRRRPPRRRPLACSPPAARPTPAPRSGCRWTRTSCCSPAGSSRSRRPTCCSGRSRCCSRATRSCAPAWSCPIVGGPSGSGLEHPESLADLADELGLGDVVRFVPPVDQPELAEWCAAATLVAVPSYNESFGLVAAEAQATGTPVVAAAVGGLTTVVRDGHSGLLVDTHEPRDWAAALRRVIGDSGFRDGSRPARWSRRGCSRGTSPPSGPSRSTVVPWT